MWGDILNIEEKSKIGGKVNILVSNNSPHAFMWRLTSVTMKESLKKFR